VGDAFEHFRPRQKHYIELVSAAAAAWEHTVVVAGNHEFYARQHEWNATLKKARECCATATATGPGTVWFLEMDEVVIRGVRFVGCTLWTRIDMDQQAYIRSRMNDYKNIKKYVRNAKTFGRLKVGDFFRGVPLNSTNLVVNL
jgi:hypothetical protein